MRPARGSGDGVGLGDHEGDARPVVVGPGGFGVHGRVGLEDGEVGPLASMATETVSAFGAGAPRRRVGSATSSVQVERGTPAAPGFSRARDGGSTAATAASKSVAKAVVRRERDVRGAVARRVERRRARRGPGRLFEREDRGLVVGPCPAAASFVCSSPPPPRSPGARGADEAGAELVPVVRVGATSRRWPCGSASRRTRWGLDRSTRSWHRRRRARRPELVGPPSPPRSACAAQSSSIVRKASP